MKNNPLLKFLVIPFAILAIVLIIKMLGSSAPQQQQGEGKPKLTEGQAKKLGVDGDTASDTLRTMVAESKQLKDQINTALKGNDELKQQNQELQRRLQNIDQTVDSRLQTVRNSLKEDAQQQNQNLVDTLKQQYESLANNKQNVGNSTGADLPIGFGVQPGDGQGFQGAPAPDVVWIEPQDATPVDANGKPLPNGSSQTANGFNFPTSFGATFDRGQNALSNSVQNAAGEVSSQEARKQVRKVYTLPQNSTLMGSVAMSALIGRIPIDGTVNDPYPFKVLIGPENLTANGIDLPDVAGAVASGTASGDWTLSCVRGQIRSLTFVFNDGTVRTLPAPADEANGNQNSSQSTGSQQTIQGGLGWISDAYGIPCISGERKSNASQYIGSQVLITAAGAGAASLIKSDGNSSSVVSTPGGTVSSTGISGNEAMGKIIGQGVNDVSSWVNKLYGQAFAAVYVQPGAKVAVHLDQQLAIDYELKGRKVDYTSGAGHVSTTLD
ncbi:TIGR03752 family integrating conjugative element protein [Pseudomonas moorei]|uniref:TIGR03752 family integrating conjugative element protein n=1 Tax=Pseudomonas moorei TaxID=395599 RepID=UPI0020101346